jgi:hypothetical protein
MREIKPMAIFEIDVAADCARTTTTDKVKIQLAGPSGSIVLDVTNEAAHQLLSQLRNQLQAHSVPQLLDAAVVATRMQQIR